MFFFFYFLADITLLYGVSPPVKKSDIRDNDDEWSLEAMISVIPKGTRPDSIKRDADYYM